MYLIFTVLGYLGALLTAIYTFRLIFRVLPGRPCKEAQELIDTGHVAHEHAAQPGDRRGGGHRRRLPRRRAPHRRAVLADAGRRWGCSPSCALFAGLVQVPGVDETITHFLDPVFADSPLSGDRALDRRPAGSAWRSAAAISLAGIGIAYWLYVAAPGDARRR